MITGVPGGIEIQVKVIPRAGRTAIAGTRNGALLVRLAAAPVDGAANDALIALLADTFDVPKRHVSLVSGQRAKSKRVQAVGLTVGTATARLASRSNPQ